MSRSSGSFPRWPALGHSRLTLVYIALYALILAATTARVDAAITCDAGASAAVNTIAASDVGLNWPCCSNTTARCIMTANDCPKAYPEFANCISADGSVVCGLNSDSFDSGSPCANYTGTVAPYGVWPVETDNSLQFDLLGMFTTNWPKIIADDSVVVCCADNNGACQLGTLQNDDVNPCKKGEYELFCVGDAKHGMCTVRANTTQTHEIGLYFRVNLDPAADPALAASGSSTAPIFTTSSGTGSATGLPASSGAASAAAASTVASGGKASHALVIALPIVLGLLVLAVICLLIFLRRRKRSRHRAVEERIDPLHAPPPSSLMVQRAPSGTVYFVEESYASTEAPFPESSTKASQMYSSDPIHRLSLIPESEGSRHGPAPPTYSET
ncbi:hypothetical protein EXIGLDRAFT_828492 [Exidia glandulosa HHB12029]|uniref:Osmotin, thaumatin-like protein n=1 Tax=Exidia glandulosa HHB12029 TaxID=1314781 RepID=A0A165QHZ1_EXIGL|nr:hypothetical protein EXIGLDRAFT_828492 [Exidia glandulosa HHB12029]